MQNKKKKTLIIILLAFILFGSFSRELSVQADGGRKPDRGQLVIHKYALGDLSHAGEPNAGEEISVAEDAIPVMGTTFTIWQVDATEDKIENAHDAKEYLIEHTKQSGRTNEKGIAVFDLPQGIYYVEETDANGREIQPDGSVSDEIKQYMPCEPFVVSVPMKKADGDGWLAEVHVYPKNQSFRIDKFVNNAQWADPDFSNSKAAKTKPVALGEEFGWTVAATIPSVIGTEEPEIFRIYDDLEQNVEYVSGTLKIYSAQSSRSLVKDATELSKGLHYREEYDDEDNILSVNFTEQGMDYLREQSVKHDERTLLLKYDCRLDELAVPGVDIFTDAVLYYEKDSSIEASVLEQPAVHTGQIEVIKWDAKAKDRRLEGAEFGIAASKEDAEKGNFVSEGTTDKNGRLVFKGIKYGKDGDYSYENSSEQQYWLVETRAPSGYIPLDKPVEVQFVHLEDVETNEYYYSKLDVYNEQEEPGPASKKDPEPKNVSKKGVKTGDASNILFIISCMMLSIAVVFILSRKRMSKYEENN